MFPFGRYARVSTNDQQALPMQNRAMRGNAAQRGSTIATQVREVGRGAVKRQAPEAAGCRREIDVVLVWRLHRWGRSVADLLAPLQDLDHLGVDFVSPNQALDLKTPAGRATAALLAVFAAFEQEILQERVRAGLAHARQNGKRLGRPITAGTRAGEMRTLHRAGVSKAEIARRLQIGRTSVHCAERKQFRTWSSWRLDPFGRLCSPPHRFVFHFRRGGHGRLPVLNPQKQRGESITNGRSHETPGRRR